MSSNSATLTRLILTERPSLLRLIRRIVGSNPAAEDVTQTLYLKVQRVGDEAAIHDHRAYLFRLASNLATDHARFEGRRDALRAEIDDLLWVEDDTASVERTVLARSELRRIEKALGELTEPTRTIFCLNRFGGLSQKAIAEKVGLSSTSVERHIRRALDILSRARSGG